MPAPDEDTRALDPKSRREIAATVSILELRSGDTLGGRFLIRERLGSGGAGTVYSALDTRVGQRVAVKVLRPELAGELNHERLRREVRAARPGHPGIVTVFDLHQHEGHVFLSMELVGGRSLRERLAERRTLPVDETAAIGAQVATALGHLHERGLVHRDVKPGNILVTPDGAAKLCDLGLARPVAEGTTVTETAMVVGTPAYMAPEQATAAGLTPASDIYALGLTLYRCLTGEVPLEGSTAIETLMLRQRARPPRLSGAATGAPRWLDRLVRRMLEPDPRDRPTAGQVVAALGSGRFPRRISRKLLIRAGIAMLATALAGAGVIAVTDLFAPRPLDPTAGLMLRVQPFNTGSTVEILDDRGNRLWRTVLERNWDPNRFLRGGRRAVAFGDVNGDGLADAVVIHQVAGHERPVEVLVRQPDGTLRLHAALPGTERFEYGGTPFVGFQPVDVHCADLDGDGTEEIVLIENSSDFYPATVRALDAEGETVFQLWHPGVLAGAATGDRDSDGRPEIYIGGTCNFLTPPASNTSKPVMMVLEADWSRRGRIVNLFAPGRSLPSSTPEGVRLLYAAWERVAVPAFQQPWQEATVGLSASSDRGTFLLLNVTEVDGAKLGLKTSGRTPLRTVFFDPDLRPSQAQWNPLVVGPLDIDPTSPGMQALLRPRYWTGEDWSNEPVALPEDR